MPPFAQIAQIDIAHPEEWGPAALVVVMAAIGIYSLLRVVFAGSRSLGQTTLPAKPYRCVLLPATRPMGFAPSAVELACRLAAVGSGGGAAAGASVLLAFLIEVPRALAVDAPLPDEEAEAERALAEAARLVEARGLRAVTRVCKGRAAAEEALRVAREEKVDLLVLPTSDPAAGPNNPSAVLPAVGAAAVDDVAVDPVRALTAELARRAPCEIVLARTAPSPAAPAA